MAEVTPYWRLGHFSVWAKEISDGSSGQLPWLGLAVAFGLSFAQVPNARSRLRCRLTLRPSPTPTPCSARLTRSRRTTTCAESRADGGHLQAPPPPNTNDASTTATSQSAAVISKDHKRGPGQVLTTRMKVCPVSLPHLGICGVFL